MSKVYEALRQKQRESDGRQVQPGQGTTMDGVRRPNAVEPELELADNVLRALVTTDEEAPRFGIELDPEFAASPTVATPEPEISPNGFRRLKLAYRESSCLVFQTDPHGLAAEQFRFLRRTLEQKFPRGGVLLVTSPAPKDGKTLTAVNLSACLADSGQSTLLLEADIRQPSVHRLLGAKTDGPGIEDVLAGTADPDRIVHFVEQLSLHVAMVGEPPDHPSRLVSGKGIQQLVEWARVHFKWVVIDSPPVLPAADVTQLVPLAHAVLLVVRAQSTPRDLTTKAIELLGTHLSGVILNEATIESNPYYRYLADYPSRKHRTTSQ